MMSGANPSHKNGTLIILVSLLIKVSRLLSSHCDSCCSSLLSNNMESLNTLLLSLIVLKVCIITYSLIITMDTLINMFQFQNHLFSSLQHHITMSDHFLSVPFFIINTMIVLLSFKSVMTHYLLSYLRNTSLLKQSNMNLINQRVMQRSGLTLNSCVLQQWEKQYTKVQQNKLSSCISLKGNDLLFRIVHQEMVQTLYLIMIP